MFRRVSSITVVEPKVTKPPMSASESMKRRRLARKKAATQGKPERIITKKRKPAWKGGGKADSDGKTFRERNDAAAKELREKRKAAAEKAPAHNPAYADGADESTESEDAGGGATDGERLDAQPPATRTDGKNKRKG